jgi:hypothetical protein
LRIASLKAKIFCPCRRNLKSRVAGHSSTIVSSLHAFDLHQTEESVGLHQKDEDEDNIGDDLLQRS